MVKITQTMRFAALGALVLGFACAGFVASASAEDATAKGGDPNKPVMDAKSGNGNGSSIRSNNVTDVSSGNGNNSTLRSDSPAVGTDSKP
jgi:hypothetical protein